MKKLAVCLVVFATMFGCTTKTKFAKEVCQTLAEDYSWSPGELKFEDCYYKDDTYVVWVKFKGGDFPSPDDMFNYLVIVTPAIAFTFSTHAADRPVSRILVDMDVREADVLTGIYDFATLRACDLMNICEEGIFLDSDCAKCQAEATIYFEAGK